MFDDRIVAILILQYVGDFFAIVVHGIMSLGGTAVLQKVAQIWHNNVKLDHLTAQI